MAAFSLSPAALLAPLGCLGGLAPLPTASVPTFGCVGSLVHSFSELFGFLKGWLYYAPLAHSLLHQMWPEIDDLKELNWLHKVAL